MTFWMMMKTSTLAIALALSLAACGQPDDSRAQDGVFADNRVLPGDALSMKASFAPVVREAAPAVVNIAARGVQQVRDPFWGIPGQRQTGSVGSGVIVRPDGVVVTNNHVIEGMQQIRVTLNDRREFSARVVLADARSDIAVLQLEDVNERLPTLNIDDREEQQIGDLVLAIGNPFGVGQTVTNGIISALNRTETGISDSGSFIQTDAAINPGNSGGALVDMDGDLIGINTAIFSRSGSSSGVGFAVPATLVKRVVDSAVGGATAVVRPWLGVKGETVSAEIARSLGLDRPQGLVVTDVWPNGPGARAGLREGDVITAIDGAEINDQGGLNFRVATREPNDAVAVAILRDGQPRTLNARVQRLPGDANIDKAAVIRSGVFSGAQVLALNPALADNLGGDPFATGVIVGRVQRGSYANGIGLRGGDIILAVNGRAVTSVEQLGDVGRGTEITISRGGQRISAVVR
ncbi:MAG: trypsin-like peptidase domain-containing protein [Brevundimonas sp.]|uniref:trypsin-like peptidase domain-containing protein n=1 Tax=Brevundimonas sp. TaxID=1871086 RepID=UPI002620EA2E|nr:trypsin-like peptidase domain-containing protein [Brevundimonas sp.]MDI6623854.1 trypsin-like peptidase domain-containing protein [Brevundimonas sp.]MDQ7812704.1 trypsin-like peptidase domain-containing protein [Brevundimonas sp.]